MATFNAQPKANVILAVQKATSKHEQALKIHRQFAHAPVQKLIKLVKSAGEPWQSDKELEQELHAIAKICKTCQQYGKAASRPVVGLPTANQFLETVAMDLKFYHQKILLHMIDHATRLVFAFPPNVQNMLLKVYFQTGSVFMVQLGNFLQTMEENLSMKTFSKCVRILTSQ